MLDFIHAEGLKGTQRPVLQSPTHHILHGMADLLPGGVKGFRRLFPGELARPVRQELACTPWSADACRSPTALPRRQCRRSRNSPASSDRAGTPESPTAG